MIQVLLIATVVVDDADGSLIVHNIMVGSWLVGWLVLKGPQQNHRFEPPVWEKKIALSVRLFYADSSNHAPFPP
jgi:hypothetical protein